jgi:imidazolonepropionase-like amidohydrolase
MKITFEAQTKTVILNIAGLTPFEAIKTAAFSAARCLKREKKSGTIEAGTSKKL